MLADNRTDKVIGRIMLLTSSIKTIKLRSGVGVPVGTVWAIIFIVLFFQPKIIIAIHNIRADGNEIMIWAFGVKVNGDMAIRFLNIIKINKEITISIVPLLLYNPSRGFISFWIYLWIILITKFLLLIIFFFKWKNYHTGD